uniref:Uncharacterized protein n=1 Tax=Tanacetum cinerariifolium TaxID=118510 RepID=A0A699HIX2_TANCI|nr:hypothetical protein [Tanacetum cinerariifolium]
MKDLQCLRKGIIFYEKAGSEGFLDNKVEYGERMWNSIEKEPYKRPMIPNSDNPQEEILEPLSKMSEGKKKQYIDDVKVMNYHLQVIPNDMYNLVDAWDSQEDKLRTAKMLLAREITQKFSTSTNNHLRTSSNTRNQVVVQDGRVDIKTKNAGYGGNDETLEELTAAIMTMALLQPADVNAETVPSYDAKAVSDVNASPKVHE